MSNEIFAGEPIRYPQHGRWFSNNGFRRRSLAIGARYADAVNAARLGDPQPALAIVIGASGQPKTFVKALLKLAKTLPEDIPPYRIEEGVLSTPTLDWGHHKGFHRPKTLRFLWMPIAKAKAA